MIKDLYEGCYIYLEKDRLNKSNNNSVCKVLCSDAPMYTCWIVKMIYRLDSKCINEELFFVNSYDTYKILNYDELDIDKVIVSEL